MFETLFIAFILTAIGAAYLYALSRERQKLIDSQVERLKALQEELKLWQNKAMPGIHPVDIPEREPRDKSKDGSPLPRILTRTEINAKLANDERLNPNLKYRTVADKARDLTKGI